MTKPKVLDIYIPPFLPKQEQFIFSKNRYIVYAGGVGSGKTYAGCHKALFLAISYPGSRGLIGTQTYTQLMDTTKKTWDEICPKELIILESKSKKTILLVNGSEILFRTLDEESKLRSLELNWFFIDEITTVSEKVFKQLKKRIRNPKSTFRCGFGATNPDSPNHWVFRHFAQGHSRDAVMISTSSHENIHLPSDYIDDLDADKGTDDYVRNVEGKWINMEGQIYKEFQRATHILPEDWEPNWKHWEFYRSIDWGYEHPFCCLFFAVDAYHNVYIIDELYIREKTLEELASMINAKYPTIYFKRTFYDPSEPGSAQTLKNHGIKGLRPANNEVFNGIMCVQEFLKASNGKPRLMVHPRCKNTIFEFENYKWLEEKRKDWDDEYKEEPKKEHDHAMDANRYFMNTRYRRKKGRKRKAA